MSSPGVTQRTLDLSAYVPSFPGVSCGMALNAKKGSLTPALVTSQAEFLRNYTLNNKVEVGYDVGYYSALAYLAGGDKLWVSRATNAALYGGAIIKSTGAVASNAGIATGLTTDANPPSYTFDSTAIVADAEETDIVCEADVDSSLNNKFFYISSPTVDYYVWFNVGAAGTDPAISGRTGVEVAIAVDAANTEVATAAQVALNALAAFTVAAPTVATLTVVNVATGLCNKPTNGNTGWSTEPDITTYGAVTDTTSDNFLIYAINPGAWNSSITVQIKTYLSDPDVVGMEDAFYIYVYYLGTLVESHLCSKLQTLRNENSNNIYIESILESSAYIRAIDSDGNTTIPKAQTVSLAMAQGSDGSAVGDTHMIAAVDKFMNPDDIDILLLMDSGWSTPAYSKKINAVCENRKDCLGILSTPYADEVSSSYVTAIVDYRKYESNINSSYCAMFTPHTEITDQFNDRKIWVSPDGYVASVISNVAVNYEPWYAPAGMRRGILPVENVRQKFDKAQRDELYNNGINPIKFVPGGGILIDGQKTLQTAPTALNRINVRMLFLIIQPAIKTVLDTFVFEINNEETRQEVVTLITEYMNDVQARGGCYGFKVVCDTTNNTPAVIDQNQMNVDFYIKPPKVAEYINFTTIITSTSAAL